MQAGTYAFTPIQYPGAMGTYPLRINKAGVIAGYFYDSGFGGHGFTYSNGTFTQIDGGSTCGSTFVTGINDSGVLSGYCFASQGGTLSFVDNNGVFTYYTLAGILDCYAEAINNRKVGVGWYLNNSTLGSFYAVNSKPVKRFSAPNAVATAAFGINNANVVVGNGIPNNAATQQGFMERGGAFTFYAYPGSYNTFFNGVNDSLQVAGDESKVARGHVTASVFQNGTFTDLLAPNASSSIAWGINNTGVVVG